MLRPIKDYFERRAIIRVLRNSVSPEGIEKILSGDGEIPPPEPRDIEFVLILINTNALETKENWNNIVVLAKQHGYIIDAFAGALIYLAQGLFPHENSISATDLAKKIQNQIGNGGRIIYGNGTALCGSIGGDDFYHYTAQLPQFPEVLGHLCSLPEGGCEEFEAN
jgi:hypothetical protein